MSGESGNYSFNNNVQRDVLTGDVLKNVVVSSIPNFPFDDLDVEKVEETPLISPVFPFLTKEENIGRLENSWKNS